ncbi:hypothetical protein BDV25DRAFT_7287 [Aspergillus avenaceus]|uniref:BZIP domain-containing protein n=1 Tax=Aspergillus avenaceus TaxID=36643 RepID=A0A5N6TS20_ASPAV|nr:hypothetical protein BDV25DRAFT_7287 [Aspergillus avenaceus]
MTSITALQPTTSWRLASTPQLPCLGNAEGAFPLPHGLAWEDISSQNEWPTIGNTSQYPVYMPNQAGFSVVHPFTNADSRIQVSPTKASVIQPNGTSCDKAIHNSQEAQFQPQMARTPKVSPLMHTGESKNWKLKRDRILQRNRQAAKRCRQRKKIAIEEIESLARSQAWWNSELRSQIDQLRCRLVDLHNEILKHAQCDDEPIKRYISQRVRKISGDQISGSSNPQTVDPQLSTSALVARPEYPASGVTFPTQSTSMKHEALPVDAQLSPCQDPAAIAHSSGARAADHSFFNLISI